MTSKRTYGDRCGIARALDVVGERWALLVVRELLLGPKRFTDLRAGLPHLGPDVLAQRLRDLEQADAFGPDSAMLALKTLFAAQRAAELDARYEIRFGPQVFSARVADGTLAVRRGSTERADVMIETEPATLAALLWHGRGFDDALRSGDLKLQGSKRTAQRFLRLFPLPD